MESGPDRPGGRWGLIRRLLPRGRARTWLARAVVAVPGVAVLFVGVGSAPTTGSKLWHDLGLPFLLFAATLPLWRRAERNLLELPRWREILRKILWRTSAILALGAIAGLIAYRWCLLDGNLSGAHTANVLGVASLLLALVPPVLEPLLWPLFPAGLRRVERTARLAEELNKALVLKSGQPRFVLTPQAAKTRRLLAATSARVEFDPGLGASGRPKPTQEYHGGPPKNRRHGTQPRRSAALSALVWWDGERFVITDRAKHRSFTLPAAARPVDDASWPRSGGSAGRSGRLARRPLEVAEIAQLETRRLSRRGSTWRISWHSLLFLDEQGYCVLTIRWYRLSWRETMLLSVESGAPCRFYRVDCMADNADKIRDLMFPRRWRSRSVYK